MLTRRRTRKYFAVLIMWPVLMFTAGRAQAQTTTLYTDLSTWQSMVLDEQFFETTAANIAKANEVLSEPGPGATNLGPQLTFDAANTSLSRSFEVTTVQSGADFIFNEVPLASYTNALSVGADVIYEDDDWSLRLLYDGTMSAFAVVLRDSRAELGESMSFYFGTDLQDTKDLGGIGTGGSVFIGFTTDYLFDRVVYNEGAGSDDIAIADFRFASNPAVVPEPISSTLFLIGGATLGFRRFRKIKKA